MHGPGAVRHGVPRYFDEGCLRRRGSLHARGRARQKDPMPAIPSVAHSPQGRRTTPRSSSDKLGLRFANNLCDLFLCSDRQRRRLMVMQNVERARVSDFEHR